MQVKVLVMGVTCRVVSNGIVLKEKEMQRRNLIERKWRLALTAAVPLACAISVLAAPRAPMVVVDERNVMREEPAPHGNIGMSTAYRISDSAPRRTMEFRKRTL